MTHQPVSSAWTTASSPRADSLADDGRRLLARGLAVAGLVGIALVHLVELPDTWRDTTGLGALFVVLVVAAGCVAAALLHSDHDQAWLAAALVAVAPIAGYVLTRSVSVPFDHDDVGNWAEPLVLVAVFIEVSTLGLCGYAWRLRRRSR